MAGIAHVMVASIEVRCAEDFYGPECLTQCLNFESCAACGLSGFMGQFCQFSVDDCSDAYCNGNGDCREGSSLCECDAGFDGDHCQTNINNGECVDETVSPGSLFCQGSTYIA